MAGAVAALPGADHLAVLFGAISARRTVTFAYRGRPRRVDPRRLSFRNGHWYLAGYDHDAGDERSFRLDRIESDVDGDRRAREPSPARATRPPPPPPLGAGGGEEPVTARLLVDAGQAGWAVGTWARRGARSGGRTGRSCWPCR